MEDSTSRTSEYLSWPNEGLAVFVTVVMIACGVGVLNLRGALGWVALVIGLIMLLLVPAQLRDGWRHRKTLTPRQWYFTWFSGLIVVPVAFLVFAGAFVAQ